MAHGFSGAGSNHLTIHNGTSDFALVRVKTARGANASELAIEPGQSRGCSLGDGRYYEVVRFGRSIESFRYTRGEGFELRSPANGYVDATLTLHGVTNGNYSTETATARDFE